MKRLHESIPALQKQRFDAAYRPDGLQFNDRSPMCTSRHSQSIWVFLFHPP